MRKFIPFLLFISLVINLVLGFFLFTKTTETQTQNAEYPYLSKRIFAENQNDILINFIPLRQALREYVGGQEGKVGVYFEYLPSGTSIGVNDSEEVKIVSLSKVPLVMSIFKKIEKGKLSQSDIVVLKKEHLDQKFGNLWRRGEGAQLSVQELIELSLVESDNTAYNVLFDQLTTREINEVYDSLDIQITQEGDNMLVSPKNYSSIFRSLYLSSYLLKEDSNKILGILTQTVFNNKIVAGVPKNILVAHKIGVFVRQDTLQDLFSDCGIIYVPNRPHILCVFVQDTDEEAQKHISYISKMVYGYIVAVKGTD